MIYLTTDEVINLHAQVIQQSGGASGIRDRGLIDSAVYQPQASFGGHELNPTLADKAAILCLSPARNHGFVDGNKRIAHAAMEVFLVRNGFEVQASVFGNTLSRCEVWHASPHNLRVPSRLSRARRGA